MAEVPSPHEPFAPGWLDRQVQRSVDTLNSLPAGVRESMGLPEHLTEEPKRRYAVVRDRDGDLWRRGNTRWTCTTPIGHRGVTNVGRLGWTDLNRMYGPLTLVSAGGAAQPVMPAKNEATCSCGKPFPEDGGAEGVCECCSTCTRDSQLPPRDVTADRQHQPSPTST